MTRYLHAGGPYHGQIREVPSAPGSDRGCNDYKAPRLDVQLSLSPYLDAYMPPKWETVTYYRYSIYMFETSITVYTERGSRDRIADVVLSSVAKAALAEGGG